MDPPPHKRQWPNVMSRSSNRGAITLSRIASLGLSRGRPIPTVEFMASRRIRLGAVAAILGLALSTTLLPTAATASGEAPAPATVEPTSKKKKKAGPPPGATTKQIQNWVQEKLTEFNSSCSPTSTMYPCKLTFKWSRVRWMGTTRVCIEGVFGRPCLKYGTAHVARVDVLVTATTDEYDTYGTFVGTSQSKTQYGYWDGGRTRVTYQPWAGGPNWTAGCSADCGKDLYVRKGEVGRWHFGFGSTSYYLR
jgi:hypothetical protein